MSLTIGKTHIVTAQFLSYDEDTDSYTLTGLSSVTATLAKYNSSLESYDSALALGTITETSTGLYSYTWTVPSSGKFKFTFTGLTADATPSTVTQERVFFVESTPESTLISDIEYSFLPELTPLYMDPEQLAVYYPDVDLVEAAQIIYSVSLELEELLGSSPEITTLVKEYLKAASLCELSKIHFMSGGMDGFESTDSFTLGDLQVSRGAGPSGGGARYGAKSWCELADILKKELVAGKIGMKGVMRGSAYENVVPVRNLRRID